MHGNMYVKTENIFCTGCKADVFKLICHQTTESSLKIQRQEKLNNMEGFLKQIQLVMKIGTSLQYQSYCQ